MAIQDYRSILIPRTASIREAMRTIDAGAIAIALVVDTEGCLLGTVTDGDIRRGLLRGIDSEEPAEKVINPHPITASTGATREEILRQMKQHQIKQVPLVSDEGRIVGIELLEDLIEGPQEKENPAVILVGGMGVRLRPFTTEVPKPLIKFGHRSVLELLIEQLRTYGFLKLYLAVNYMREKIEAYFGDGSQFGVDIQYLREHRPLGTSGPLYLAKEILNYPFFVINGDLLTKVNFEHFMNFHLEGGLDLTMGVKHQEVHLPFGVVRLDHERVVALEEKPSQLFAVNAGIYALNPDLISLIPEDTYYDMTD